MRTEVHGIRGEEEGMGGACGSVQSQQIGSCQEMKNGRERGGG